MSFTALGKWKVLEGFMNGFRLGRVLGSGSLRSGQGAVMRYFRSAVTQSIGLATSCLVLWVTWANAQQTITLSCDGVSKLMATSAGDLSRIQSISWASLSILPTARLGFPTTSFRSPV